jgi:hypothetical protein
MRAFRSVRGAICTGRNRELVNQNKNCRISLAHDKKHVEQRFAAEVAGCGCRPDLSYADRHR